MNHETFEKLLKAVEDQGQVSDDLGGLSNARALRAAFYKWRRGLEGELRTRSERVMVNVREGRITFYLQGQRMERLVEGLLQNIA